MDTMNLWKFPRSPHQTAFCTIALLCATLGSCNISGLEFTNTKGARIAGGDLAREQQFPYQAGLSVEYAPGQYDWCGGSLISQNWVLTAAHCVDNIKSLIVYLGATKRLEPSSTLKVPLSNIYVHFEWNTPNLANDIALLQLPQAVAYTAAIQPVALPRLASAYSSYTYHEAIASGWGRMSDASSLIANELRFVVRFVESNEECQRVYGASVRSSNLCMDTTGGKSTCTGDSGGPLVVHDTLDGYTLIGLTSFGKLSGCTKGYPAVFTRITSFLDWIHAIADVPNQ